MARTKQTARKAVYTKKFVDYDRLTIVQLVKKLQDKTGKTKLQIDAMIKEKHALKTLKKQNYIDELVYLDKQEKSEEEEVKEEVKTIINNNGENSEKDMVKIAKKNTTTKKINNEKSSESEESSEDEVVKKVKKNTTTKKISSDSEESSEKEVVKKVKKETLKTNTKKKINSDSEESSVEEIVKVKESMKEKLLRMKKEAENKKLVKPVNVRPMDYEKCCIFTIYAGIDQVYVLKKESDIADVFRTYIYQHKQLEMESGEFHDDDEFYMEVEHIISNLPVVSSTRFLSVASTNIQTAKMVTFEKEVKEEVVEKKEKKEKKEEEVIEKKEVKEKKVEKEKEVKNDIIEGVDIFDFDLYSKEFVLMARYFDGLELYLRTALFIDYKYNHLSEKNRNVVEETLKEKENKKEFIESLFDVFEPLYLLTHWFNHFAPEKLKNPNHVQNLIIRYEHHLDGLFNKAYKNRIDKTWPLDHMLWFSEGKKMEESNLVLSSFFLEGPNDKNAQPFILAKKFVSNISTDNFGSFFVNIPVKKMKQWFPSHVIQELNKCDSEAIVEFRYMLLNKETNFKQHMIVLYFKGCENYDDDRDVELAITCTSNPKKEMTIFIANLFDSFPSTVLFNKKQEISFKDMTNNNKMKSIFPKWNK